MPADTFGFSRKLTQRLILMYRDFPCLWDRKNRIYRHKQKRHEAISQLTGLVREDHPNATPAHVMRKIDNLRVSARREFKRVCDSGTDVYVPQLWYYDLISFVFEAWSDNRQELPELGNSAATRGAKRGRRKARGKRVTELSNRPIAASSNLRGVPLAVQMSNEYNLGFSRKLTERFILMYRDFPCLWDRNNKNYRHRQKRHEAISQLTALVREDHPSATPVHVMRKIENLRACARREHNRVYNSQFMNSGTKVYVPHLWYYDLISFVFERWPDVKEKSPELLELDIGESDDNETTENVHKFEATDEEVNRPTSIIEITNNMPRQYSFGDQTSKRQSGIQDEYDAIGINVAAKLRSLPPSARIIAEKLINDVLFQAQVNGLTSSSIILTPDPIKQDNTL